MNVITHALLPVAAKQVTELRRKELPAYRSQWRGWAVVGLAGILPDLLNPHISLGGRCNSFSHGWVFTLAVVLTCVAYRLWRWREPSGRLALWCAAAYVLHVAGDIVSGGLDFLGNGRAIGDWWIAPEMWPVLDLATVLAFVLLHRRIRRRHGLEPSAAKAWRVSREVCGSSGESHP